MRSYEHEDPVMTKEVDNSEYQWILDKRISVIGAAISGVAVARFLKRHGAFVFVSDVAELSDKKAQAANLTEVDIPFEFGGHTERALECDFMVISPGVPTQSEIVQKAVGLKIPVYSEIEVASWFLKSPAVAVTGSNGKTTTTALIGAIMQKVNPKTIVAGNIGQALSTFVDESQNDGVAVLEVSSYQAEGLLNFKPHVGVLLNLSPDHLDRYDSVVSYYMAKKRLFMNQRSDDFLIYNKDDDTCEQLIQDIRARKIPFSANSELRFGAFVSQEQLTVAIEPDLIEPVIPIKEIGIRGKHNLQNAMAATLAARLMAVPAEVIAAVLKDFKGVPHRLEFAGRMNDVDFFNDSKATNVDSVWYALESFTDRKIVLIAGGKDKGTGYESLKTQVEQKVRSLVLIGEAAQKIEDALGGLTQTVRAQSMADAVRVSFERAEPGDVILLSPACASFDMFRNFEDRGDQFKAAVAALIKTWNV